MNSDQEPPPTVTWLRPSRRPVLRGELPIGYAIFGIGCAIAGAIAFFLFLAVRAAAATVVGVLG